jgi:transposase-like protein
MENEVNVDVNEERTLEQYMKLHKPKNRRSDDEKRAILAQVGSKPGMTVSAVAWLNRIPVNYLYRWQQQLDHTEGESDEV